MSELFAAVPIIGNMYFRTIYLFYEEPQIFSCMASESKPHFVISVPQKGEEESAWLAAYVSEEKLTMLEKNMVDIRTPFVQPESEIWRISKTQDCFKVESVQPSELQEDMLPMPGALLEYAG